MKTETEKEFFEVFGIESDYIRLEDDYGHYKSRDKCYPQITDRILLELIEIIIKRDFDILKLYKFDNSYHSQFDSNINKYFVNYQESNLKDVILAVCEGNSKIFYKDVRKLFGLKK